MPSDLQAARTFLNRVLPWPTDAGQQEFINIHNNFVPKELEGKTDPKTGIQSTKMAGQAFRDLGAAAGYIKWQNGQTSSKDIYFCTSTQSYAEPAQNRRGNTYYKAKRSLDGASLHKSLFIDCDLKGGEHGYESRNEFISALAAFLKATGMPKPTVIVNTGGGFHIYWTLSAPLPTEEWYKLAYALAEATKREGFKCDTQCTIDAARILRVPETLNYKYDPAREVTLAGNVLDFDYMNAKIEGILKPYMVAVPLTSKSANVSILPPRTPIDGVSDLAGGVDMSNHAPIVIDSLVHECGFIAEALATGGQNNQQPLWNLTTLISTFTKDGRANAHRMSSGHRDYGPGETDELYDRKDHEKITRNLGWPSCATISGAGCTHCATCPHFGQGKSPLHFGAKAVAPSNQQTVGLQGGSQAGVSGQQAPTQPAGQGQAPNTHSGQPLGAGTVVPGQGTQDPDLPTGYLRTPDGVILFPFTLEDNTQTWMPVIHYPMMDPWLQSDPWNLNFTTVTARGRKSQITLPTSDVGRGEMRQALQSQGFMITGGARGFNVLSEFLMAWITSLQQNNNRVLASVPFGWKMHNGKTEGFVYNGRCFTPNGDEVASTTDPELARQFTPQGNKQDWIDAAAMVTAQQRSGLDVILAASFGAPLVKFTGHQGLLLSAYSAESGIGKSTAMRIAQAVWGDPVRAIQSLSDTQNSVLHKLGELRSLPMFWDELKSEQDTQRFVDTVFRLTLGKEKSRMRQNLTQRTPGTWQTIMVSASNDSILDTVSDKTRGTMAGLYRVFEYVLPPAGAKTPGQIDPTIAQRMVSKLNDNYGLIGLEYAQFLGENPELVEKDVGDKMSMVGRETAAHADERFWVALIASLLLGADYANKLSFTRIDTVLLKDFLYNTLKSLRAERDMQPTDMRSTDNVVNVLGQFFNEKRSRNTLFTKNIHKSRGKPSGGSVEISRDASRLEAIHMHVGTEDKIVRIGTSYLRDWLQDHNYPRLVLMNAMKAQLGAKQTFARLGAGTQFANASEYVIEIDLTQTPLLNFVDEA